MKPQKESFFKLTIRNLVNGLIKLLTKATCRIDTKQLHKIPEQGPLILAVNHINFLEVPIMYTHLLPRPMVGFAKIETWENPLLGWLFDLWHTIPVRRGEADTLAMKRAVKAIKEGNILAIAPEGTRSGHGRMQQGLSGVTMFALMSKAPIQPAAYYGGEKFRENIKRLRRTDFHIVVGNPFYLDAHGEKVTQAVRNKMTTEIMYQIAALLPPAYRGIYADRSKATENYLRFVPPSESNLKYWDQHTTNNT